MKIGILTYHDEINYGSLLQAYAMQTALSDLGYESAIIDRWFEPRQTRIYGVLHASAVRAWVKWVLKVISGTGAWALFIRQWRSRRFIEKFLRLTPYSFHNCGDAPNDMGIDLITVGSDQVWHPMAQPHIYLLNELKQVPGIAYAASFGTNAIPDSKQGLYREGLKNFKAIGIRELEGVEIVRQLGVRNVAHVVDPTILVNPKRWHEFVHNLDSTGKRHIVCYFLGEDFLAMAERLGRWARSHNMTIDFFLQDFEAPIPFSAVRFRRWLQYWKVRLSRSLNFRSSAGPIEFVRKISTAECVFTNSFHALMFSMIFKRNVRIVKPTSPIRQGMSARMREFSETIIEGPLIMETLEDAISSYERGERVLYNEQELMRRRIASRTWLQKAIKIAVEGESAK